MYIHLSLHTVLSVKVLKKYYNLNGHMYTTRNYSKTSIL